MATKTRSRRGRKASEGPSPAEAIVADLISLLEAGTTPWRKPWEASGGGHHVNLLSGHRYSGANPILLTLGMHLRGSALPFWCGFAEAKKLGIFPKKGSKAVRILRPQLHSREEEGEGGEISLKSWASFRPVAIFNSSDLQGEALEGLIASRKAIEEPQVRPEPERHAAAEATLSAWCVPISRAGDRAFYMPELDRIQLPERHAFTSSTGHYATWAHEVIHSTGHNSRLKRNLSGAMGSHSYAREELVAELGAVLLGDRLEIGAALEGHAAYMGHWIEMLKAEQRVLFQVLSEARQAADLICPNS
ncbi:MULTISPECIES: ArdC family protein [unclassified Synechococcus]|uniref:ArdC family protein n=1 Tax=unclassified Synechococcus TaxID=2626047 RepID=UPI000A82EFAF|nr:MULTISPECIES: zincin-like metallopeptidase domain-containing protein [unclassified Synechococcus]TWB88997.1 antirestriction protein ArdC [Synechococcus sp. Ace-Pa]